MFAFTLALVRILSNAVRKLLKDKKLKIKF
jgi:hypothetical protein